MPATLCPTNPGSRTITEENSLITGGHERGGASRKPLGLQRHLVISKAKTGSQETPKGGTTSQRGRQQQCCSGDREDKFTAPSAACPRNPAGDDPGSIAARTD